MLGAALALVAAGCASSGGDGSADPGAGRTTASTTGGTSAGGHACDQGATLARVESREVSGTPTDRIITSFDDTEIRTHWFPVDGATEGEPAPTILMGPGWSLPGDTSEGGAALFGAASIKGLHDAGYNVLTWDPRGFGKSGGTVTVDDPTFEGGDVRALLDWVATQPEAQLDGKGDPRSGMVGFSYGGGIQLAVASEDCRVDALVPGLTWHSLATSLYQSETPKLGWANFLYQAAVGAGGRLDPHLASSSKGAATGVISDEDRTWFVSRGPGKAVSKIDVPTLFVSGTVDTLFPLDEVIANYRALVAQKVPTAMVWFCGGHGTCLTDAGPNRIDAYTLGWLDRYVKGDAKAKVAPALDLVDQDGAPWTADRYPVPLADPVEAKGSGTLELKANGGAGPLPKGGDDILSGLVAPFTTAKATNAVNVVIDPGQVDALAIGAPKLTLTYRRGPTGTLSADSEARPQRVFAQLVDDDTGNVVGSQVTPVPVELDGREHTTTIALEVIAQHLRPGHTLTLQIVATTVAYAEPQLSGSVEMSEIGIELPVAKDLKPAP